jgi:hypothetical protein
VGSDASSDAGDTDEEHGGSDAADGTTTGDAPANGE